MSKNKVENFLIQYKWFLLAIILLIVLFFIYNYTQIFTIKAIEIYSIDKGNIEYIDLNTLNNELNKYKGQKYFNLNTKQASQNINSFSTYIETSLVFKQFPDKLSVHILERNPFIALKFNTNCVLLDVNGFVIESLTKNCDKEFPKVDSILVQSDDPKLQFNKGTNSNYHQIDKIEQVIKVLNEYKLGVTEVLIVENIANFKINGKNYIRISFNQDLILQLSRLVAVLTELEKKNLVYTTIDVRPERPIIK